MTEIINHEYIIRWMFEQNCGAYIQLNIDKEVLGLFTKHPQCSIVEGYRTRGTNDDLGMSKLR